MIDLSKYDYDYEIGFIGRKNKTIMVQKKSVLVKLTLEQNNIRQKLFIYMKNDNTIRI